MSYDENDPRLTAYALDEADAEERAALEQAIASDPALKSIVDELSNASRVLAEAIKAEGRESEELHPAQRTQIETCAAEVKHPRRNVLRRRLAYVGIAAALLVLAGTLTLKGELERNIAAWFPTPEQMLLKTQRNSIAKGDTQHPSLPGVSTAESIYREGVFFYTKEQYTEAKAAFARALELEPEHNKAQQMLQKTVGKIALSSEVPTSPVSKYEMKSGEATELSVGISHEALPSAPPATTAFTAPATTSGKESANESGEAADRMPEAAPVTKSAAGGGGALAGPVTAAPETPAAQGQTDAKKKDAEELVVQGQFYLENKKFSRAKDLLEQSLQKDPGNSETKRLLGEATIGAYDQEINKAWEHRNIDRQKIRLGIEQKKNLPEGADDKGIKEPPQLIPAGESNRPKLTPDEIDDLKSLGYAEESREQIAKTVLPDGLADLDEYQVNMQGNKGALYKGHSNGPATGEFDPTLQPNASANGAINGPGVTSFFSWQDTDTNASENPSVLGQVVVPVDVNGDGILENVPIYTKPDGTNVLNNTTARGAITQRQQRVKLDFQRNIPESTSESYAPIVENSFKQVSQEPLSTFGLDVDTASYANSRRFLSSGQLPPPNAVRIEEFVNAFKYEYAAPTDDRPVALRGEIASCPWNPEHRLARIAVKAKDIPFESQPPLRLTFLIDVSGSMEDNNKLPLLRESMKALVARLRPTDQVAIVTYRDTAQRELSPTPATSAENICAAIDALRADGSTNGAGGIELAYAAAKEQYLGGGLNRVILATDGDFNVGETENAALVQRITEHAKSGVFLTVLGFGIDNLQDDRLEGLADKGNGNYFYIDSFAEANKVLVDRMAGTIAVAAKDVKIQVEFNPAKIGAYRLLGYENRALAAQDFNDDRKDAGDLGAGHTVTALYELVPVGVSIGAPGVDELKYQPSSTKQKGEVPLGTESSQEQILTPKDVEAMTVKLRYKKPDASESEHIELPLTDTGLQFGNAPSDFRFATSAAAFAMLLRNSQHAGSATLDMVQQIAEKSSGSESERKEFVSLVVAAKTLVGDRAPAGKGAIGVRLDNIIKWRDGEYRAEITTDASGKSNLYKEGEVFENYKLMSIDPLNKLVNIYSSQHDKVFELRLW